LNSSNFELIPLDITGLLGPVLFSIYLQPAAIWFSDKLHALGNQVIFPKILQVMQMKILIAIKASNIVANH